MTEWLVMSSALLLMAVFTGALESRKSDESQTVGIKDPATDAEKVWKTMAWATLLTTATFLFKRRYDRF